MAERRGLPFELDSLAAHLLETGGDDDGPFCLLARALLDDRGDVLGRHDDHGEIDLIGHLCNGRYAFTPWTDLAFGLTG